MVPTSEKSVIDQVPEIAPSYYEKTTYSFAMPTKPHKPESQQLPEASKYSSTLELSTASLVTDTLRAIFAGILIFLFVFIFAILYNVATSQASRSMVVNTHYDPCQEGGLWVQTTGRLHPRHLKPERCTQQGILVQPRRHH
ncbi:hypothetical protein BJ508DRAFT_302152 [Ascobolus immersus RN42]|uniref:Uncharacterized protein n=1 Tax=Ascobolus immersus RN42 TaxID=1160509 RepID=A0A3N4IKR3_ASCIM|nr:hypothetical protein BJ508DRAFT_302152 [Ascobolus immersus RN42]